MYDQAYKITIEENRITVAMLQRRLRIGYCHAARLIDRLVENGVIESGKHFYIVKSAQQPVTPELESGAVIEGVEADK